MKIKDAINMANLMEQGNVLPKELAILFLSELDGMIQSDIMLHAPEEIVSYDNEEQELLLRPPHDKLYVHYLVMMIRNQQQEYEGYQNSQAAVDEKLKTFQRWYVQHYCPADTDSRSYMGGTSADAFGFAYLTAYGLAVRNGYQGTEEQWLESLHGAPGDPGEPARMRYDAEREMIQWGVGEVWYDLFSLQTLRDPAVDAFLREAEAAAQSAARSEEAANQAAGTAQSASSQAQTAAQTAQTAVQSAQAYSEEAWGWKEMAQTAATQASTSVDDAQVQAATAQNHAQNAAADAARAEAAAKRAENAQGGGGVSPEAVEMVVSGHNVDRYAHDDIRKQVRYNADLIGELDRNKLGADALPGAVAEYLTKNPVTAEQVGADPKGTAEIAVVNHNVDAVAHKDIRDELARFNAWLNAFADSDDQTLDELSEIVAYIKSNKTLIDAITTSKVSVADIVNDLTTNVANKPLSAAMGAALSGEIDSLRSSKLDASKLTEAINTALAQAKANGEFDGDKGDPGRGIKSIARTSGNGAAGSLDTYTITYTDGSKSTYQVRNGSNGIDGDDGISPHIGGNGNWFVGTADTGVRAQGVKGDTGSQGPKGDTGAEGPKGDKGDTGAVGPQGPAYTLTDADKAAITAAVIEALPKYAGEVL